MCLAPLDEGQSLAPSDLPICRADWGSDSEPEKVFVVHPKAFARWLVHNIVRVLQHPKKYSHSTHKRIGEMRVMLEGELYKSWDMKVMREELYDG